MWKTFADYFGVRTEEPGDKALDLEKLMSDKGPVWDEIVQKHGLQVCCITASHFERWVATHRKIRNEKGFVEGIGLILVNN